MSPKDTSAFVLKIISWIVAVFLILIGLGLFLSSSVIGGLVFLMMSIVLIPPAKGILKDKFGDKTFKRIRSAVIIVGIIVIVVVANIEAPRANPSQETKENPVKSTEITLPAKESADSKPLIFTKPLVEMLPLREDIPTEFSMGDPSNFTPKQIPDGFDSGVTLSATRVVGTVGIGVILVDFSILKYKSSEQARVAYDLAIGHIKKAGGYTEISVSVPSDADCFSFFEDYGYQGRIATSKCVEANLIYQVQVNVAQAFDSPKTYLKDMIRVLDNRVNK